MNESDTPRTDLAADNYIDMGTEDVVGIEFARTLERELAASHDGAADVPGCAGPAADDALKESTLIQPEHSVFPDIGKDPLQTDGAEREVYYGHDAILARLGKACSLQQKEVPDQTALVWRADLSHLLGQFAWREAGHLRMIERYEKEKAHSGDCAIYRHGVEFCDCGKARRSGRTDPNSPEWTNHLARLEALPQSPAPSIAAAGSPSQKLHPAAVSSLEREAALVNALRDTMGHIHGEHPHWIAAFGLQPK